MQVTSLRGLTLLAGFTLCMPCWAQTEAKQAVAEALYLQARDLMAAGKLAEACPKFAESQRLDPATGTLLNLAACHEKQGKLATAWLEFSDGLAGARRDGRQDRVDFAAARLAALEPRVSHVSFVLSPEAEGLDLTLELDGASFGRAALGVPTPVDPGKHSVRVHAPGKQPWQQTIQIGAEADQQTLTIPALDEAPPPPVAPAPPAKVPPVAPAPPPSAGSPRDELDARPVPTSVYIGAGVTAALVVGASATSVVYLSRRKAYQDDLPGGGNDELERERKSALRMGYVNLGLWGGAVAAAGVTAVLYLTRPRRAAAAYFVPFGDQTQAGLAIVGGF